MNETQKNITIKQLAEEDRPREKLLYKGRHTLSNAELIAILISSGNSNETAVELSQRILAHYNNDLNVLGKLQVSDLTAFKGIGDAKAISIIAALELGRRRQASDVMQKLKIKSSKDIFDILLPLMSDLPHEEFWVLYLNKANKVLGTEKLSAGGISGTVVDIKMLLKNALQKLACAIAVAHNHPSGNLSPSNEDISLTKKIREAAQFLDIVFIDHIIMGEKDYFSFADNGLI